MTSREVLSEHYTSDESSDMFIINWRDKMDYMAVLNTMIERVDILFVDPKIYPHLVHPIISYLGIARQEQDYEVVEKLEYFQRYIAEYPEKREAEILISKPIPEPVIKPPPLTDDQVQEEIEKLESTGEIKYFRPDELPLVLEGLRKKRIEYIKAGNYLAAERAEHYSKAVLTFGQLGTVEELQGNKVSELQKKLEAAKSEMQRQKDFWDQKLEELRQATNQELTEMEQMHKKEISQLEELLKNPVPANRVKPTSEILNLKRSQQAAIKQRKFAEAGRLKDEIAALEVAAQSVLQQKWEAEIGQKISNTVKKQQADMDVRHAYWRGEQMFLVRKANRELENAQRAVDHIEHSIDLALHAKNMAAGLKDEQQDSSSEAERLPHLDSHKLRHERALAHRQRAILNHKIYTIRPAEQKKAAISW